MEELKIKNYEQAVQAGIALVPQELSFCGLFTVAENIYLGRQPLKGHKPELEEDV